MLSFILKGCKDCDSLEESICGLDAALATFGKNAWQNISYLTNRPLIGIEVKRLMYYREIMNNLKWDQTFYSPYCFPDIVSRAIILGDRVEPIVKRGLLPPSDPFPTTSTTSTSTTSTSSTTTSTTTSTSTSTTTSSTTT